jgi:hypothetical protein
LEQIHQIMLSMQVASGRHALECRTHPEYTLWAGSHANHEHVQATIQSYQQVNSAMSQLSWRGVTKEQRNGRLS